jgi:hypothetical protein
MITINGKHPAGDRAAVIYSLIVSAQRRELDPHAYLKDVLTRLPAMISNDGLTRCCPHTGSQPALRKCRSECPLDVIVATRATDGAVS